MRIKLTDTQEQALQLDSPEILSAHGLEPQAKGWYEATPQAWSKVRDEAEFFAADYQEQQFGHPFAGSLRGLARKIATALVCSTHQHTEK